MLFGLAHHKMMNSLFLSITHTLSRVVMMGREWRVMVMVRIVVIEDTQPIHACILFFLFQIPKKRERERLCVYERKL